MLRLWFRLQTDCGFLYGVDRSRFDLLLLKHAEKLGSRVCQGVCVKEVLFDAGHAVGVRASVAGRTVDIPARIVADACS